MHGKGWRSIQESPLPPPPQATSLLRGCNFEFSSFVLRLAESPLSSDFCLRVPSHTAHKSRSLGKSFLDIDEERITKENVCQQLACTSHLVSQFNSPANQPLSSHPDSLLVNFYSRKETMSGREER